MEATEANIKRFSDNKHRDICRKLKELRGRHTVQTEVPRIDIFDRGHRHRPDPPEKNRERPMAERETTNLRTPTATRPAITTTKRPQEQPAIVKKMLPRYHGKAKARVQKEEEIVTLPNSQSQSKEATPPARLPLFLSNTKRREIEKKRIQDHHRQRENSMQPTTTTPLTLCRCLCPQVLW